MPRLRWVNGVIIEEPLPHEVATPGRRGHVPAVALPEDGWSTETGRTVRDTREQLAADTVQYTDGSPAARAWAESKATEAARRHIRNT